MMVMMPPQPPAPPPPLAARRSARPSPRGGPPTTALPASPRAAAAAKAAMRGSSHSLMSSGMMGGGGAQQQQQQQQMMAAAHAQRQHEMRALVASAQERMAATARREKMKKLMQSAANERGEVPVDDVLLTAELANVALDPQQKELIFRTPYAQRYATTYDVTSERTVYGLESTPRSVNWRQFDAAMRAPSLGDPSRVEAALKRYADTEAAAIAEQRRRDEEAEARAKARALASNMPVEKARGISDDELRMVHKMVKTRLSTQFAQIREAFRSFDTDHSGNISAKECADALLSLNVGVPRKFIDHLVNIADYDRDGEINYAEFARILTCDDIVAIKKEGAEEEGLVETAESKAAKVEYKPGITYVEMRSAQGKIRDMMAERGGITKMFRAIDEDKSNKLSRKEVRQLIINLNLENVIKPKIIEELINLMDVDGDNEIELKELARVITADDIFEMAELAKVPEKKAVKLTKKQRRMLQKRSAGFA